MAQKHPYIQIPVGTSVSVAEALLIEATLKFYKGNKVDTAFALGVSLKTLYNKLHRYGAM